MLRWRSLPSRVYCLTREIISIRDNVQFKIAWDIFAKFKAIVVNA